LSFRYFGGIDFSGAREPLPNLWTAVGEERAGKLHILWLQPHPFREDLRSYVANGWRRTGCIEPQLPILWGADFPFGIPAAAAGQLAAGRRASWSAMASWVADRPADEVREEFSSHGKTPRATDTGGALAPFDLRLYRQTVEGIRWLHALRDEIDVSILPVAPGDAPNTIVEVYPSGASKEIGMKGGRLPSRPGEVRARPAALRTFMTFDHPSLEAAACTLEDARDACMACLVAWLCREDLEQPERMARVSPEQVALEGWIYRPPAALVPS
jgi:hypothetical protein